MSVAKLEQRAKQALQNRMFGELKKLVPSSDLNDSRAMLRWLEIAASYDEKGAQRAGFREAHAALTELNSARDLQDRIAQIYHDPRVQLAAADRGLDWYFQRPEAAYKALLAASASGAIDQNLAHDLMLTARAAADFNSEHGVAESAIPQQPTPATEAGRAAEWQKLIGKSVTADSLTPDETRRLHALAASLPEGAAAEDVAAHRKALGLAPAKPDEYARLIQKSVTGGINAAEQNRLFELATARGIADGTIGPDDTQSPAATEQPTEESEET